MSRTMEADYAIWAAGRREPTSPGAATYASMRDWFELHQDTRRIDLSLSGIAARTPIILAQAEGQLSAATRAFLDRERASGRVKDAPQDLDLNVRRIAGEHLPDAGRGVADGVAAPLKATERGDHVRPNELRIAEGGLQQNLLDKFLRRHRARPGLKGHLFQVDHSRPSEWAPTKPLVEWLAKGRSYITRPANLGDALVWLVALPLACAAVTALVLGA